MTSALAGELALKAGRRALALLWQILVTMLAVAIYAPVLYFLDVLLVRPAPPTYSLDAIACERNGRDAESL
jgi:hypothetical protein